MMRIYRLFLAAILSLMIIYCEARAGENQILKITYYLLTENSERLIDVIREKAAESGA